MKILLLFLVIVVNVVTGDLPLALPCEAEKCELPECRCSSTSIPGGLAAKETPQFFTITFDDAINVMNLVTYRDILYNRHNTNGCRAGATFYINHEYTNYNAVNELYNEGFEIALHTISHRTPQTYWAEATYDTMVQELIDQRVLMGHFANIPNDEMKGVRMPFLQMTGNSSFQVMADFGIIYDATWPTVTSLSPGLWPYTLHYASTQECVISPCPTASIPGPWVMPMISWLDQNGIPCPMVDSCFFVPKLDDEDEWFDFILINFERHYHGNRAPFGFYIHEWYLRFNPAVKRALARFMDLINSLNDVFMVNSIEVIEWVKNPIPTDEYRRKPCKVTKKTNCTRLTCGPLRSDHNNLDYWMESCTSCPRTYPWVGNPLGQ